MLAAAACTAPDGPPPRFVAHGTAVVRDGETGLQWTRRDDGEGRAWPAAETYCRTLPVDGGGWRLPVIEELRRLYGGAPRVACGTAATCAIDPLFTLSSPWVWTASAPQGPGARTYLDFAFGTELTPSIGPRLLRNVLCVRGPAPAVS